MKFVLARVYDSLPRDAEYVNLAQVHGVKVQKTEKYDHVVLLSTTHGYYMLTNSFPTSAAAHMWVRSNLEVVE